MIRSYKSKTVVVFMVILMCAISLLTFGCGGNTNGTKTFSKDPERELRDCLAKVITTHKISDVQVYHNDKNKDGVGSIFVNFESNASEFIYGKGLTKELRNIVLKDVTAIAKEIAKYKGLDDNDVLTIGAYPYGQREKNSYCGFKGEISFKDLKNYTAWDNINIDAKLMRSYQWNDKEIVVEKDEKSKITTLKFYFQRAHLKLPAEWYNKFHIEKECRRWDNDKEMIKRYRNLSVEEIRFYLTDSVAAGNEGLLFTYHITGSYGLDDSMIRFDYPAIGDYYGEFNLYRLAGGYIFYKPADITKLPKQDQEKYGDLLKQIPNGFDMFGNLKKAKLGDYIVFPSKVKKDASKTFS